MHCSTSNLFCDVTGTGKGGAHRAALSARHSLATNSPSSVLQNGCSSASLNRLSRALGLKHSCCRLVAASLDGAVQCAPADCWQQESFCHGLGPVPALHGKLGRARTQDLHWPSSTPWRRGEAPSAAALRRQAGRRLPCTHLGGKLVQA